MKVIRAVILIVVILGLTYLISHILKLEEFVEQLEMEKNVLKLDKQLLEEKVDRLHLKYEDCKRSRKSIEATRSSSRGRLLGTFEATAYTDDVESQGKWVGQTASGLKPQVGVVAVDPKIIPLGTKLYVEGYGNAIAGDVGGAIKGKMLDVFLPDKDSCMKWGRREVKVWRIE
jgi:3D (Asp-Asp-Asp) domain-containing protein